MSTVWQQVEVRGISEIPGLPGTRVEALPVFKDTCGSLQELNSYSPYQLPQS